MSANQELRSLLKKQHAARTAALRAPEKKLFKVSVEGIMSLGEHLVMATTAYEAMQKAVAAKHPTLNLDAPSKMKTYKNESGVQESQTYMRARKQGLSHAWCVWAQEAEVIQ